MMKRFLVLAGASFFAGSFFGCANELPDVEATFGTGGPPSGTGGETAGSADNTGNSDQPEDFCVQAGGELGPEVANPVLYQCQGQGGGQLTWLQCGALLGCGEEPGITEVEIVFPPEEDDEDDEGDEDLSLIHI